MIWKNVLDARNGLAKVYFESETLKLAHNKGSAYNETDFDPVA